MRRSLIFVLALVLGGCPRPPVRAVDPRPLPKPEALVESLLQQGQSRRSLRALGRVDYFGKEGRVRLRIVEVVERPDRFRFETLSPLEQPIDLMTCDGSRLRLLSKGALREGPATPENIARLLPLPLRPEEVVEIMLGGAPISGRFTPRNVEWTDDDQWRLMLDGPEGEVGELIIDPTGPVATRATLKRANGDVRLGLTFDDLEPIAGGGRLPRTIALSLPDDGLEVSIRLKEVEVNVEVSPTLFTITPPPGVIPEPLPSPPASLPAVAPAPDPR